MRMEKGEETQTKGLDNVFNKTRAENFPDLDKRGSSRYRRLSKYKQTRSEKKHPQA
jgi:hypothetical protein